MSEEDPAVIEAKAVSYRPAGTPVLQDVSLRVAAGERVALLGSNGAGKTSLFRVLTGVAEPHGGSVTVLGQNPHALGKRRLREFRRQVGIIHQGLNVVGRLSVLENVLIGRLGWNRSPATWAGRFPPGDVALARECLGDVGLDGMERRRADTLSGGERQRVAIARVLAQRSELVFADEPIAALDPRASRDIAVLLGGLSRQRGITLLTILHDIEALDCLADRVIGLKEGTVAFDKARDQVEDATTRVIYQA